MSIYNWENDPFYSKSTYYTTWLNVWAASTERHWFLPESSNGALYQVNGLWQAPDMFNETHILQICEETRDAHIDVIVCDLTNGTRWETCCRRILQFCKENGMKMCVAINHNGSNESYETQAENIWKNYVSPQAPNHEAYFYKEGGPLIVNYCIREGFDSIQGERKAYQFASKFSGVWASGENSDVDKWGWQLESLTGPIPSKDSMFITPSICNHLHEKSKDEWRKSLSWLDYTFAAARKTDPKYYVIGAYDDLYECNGFMLADTTDCQSMRYKMRDIYGEISIDTYYKRTVEWIKNGYAKAYVPGGVIADGAYRLSNNGQYLTTGGLEVSADVILTADAGISSYIWFYHLGDNIYRILRLNSGLSLTGRLYGDPPYQTWDSKSAAQRWTAQLVDDHIIFTNVLTGDPLNAPGCNGDNWQLEAILTL